MNISISDLIIFIKKNLITSIFVLVVSFGLFFLYSGNTKPKDVLNFQVDLIEWKYLNVNRFPFLMKYTKYADEIKYSIVNSFDKKAKCNNEENISNLLFCSVKGELAELNDDYDKFSNQVSFILQKQDLEFKYEIEGRVSKIEKTRKFIENSSKSLIDNGKVELLTDLNYKGYMAISEIEANAQLLENKKNIFKQINIIKSKKIKLGEVNYDTKYGILFSILCLAMYVIMGLSYTANYKKNKKKTK